jgi:hypothetical protein
MSDPVHSRFREQMLTAELEELRGQGNSELAAHLRGCATCAAAAQRILGATAQLAAVRNAMAPIATRKRRRIADSQAWWALPIAAVLATVLVAGNGRTPEPLPRVGSLEDVKRPVTAPVVNTPATRNVAVFRTAENIVVVWDLGAKGGS